MLHIDILREVQDKRRRLGKTLVAKRVKALSQKLQRSLDTLFYEKFAVEINILENDNRTVKRLDNQPLTSEQKLFIDTFLKGFNSAVDILGESLFQPLR